MRIYRGLQPIKAMTFDLDDTLSTTGLLVDHEGWEGDGAVTFESTLCLLLYLWKSDEAVKQQVALENPQLKHDVTLWH